MAPDTERALIVATVSETFDAMREHDEGRLRQLVAEGAVIIRVAQNEEGRVKHAVVSVDDFIKGTAGDKSMVIDERILGTPEVQWEGIMATVWADYDVRINGEYSHCGVDAVQLAKLEGRWTITAITYTARKEGCDSGPDEPSPQS